MLLPAYIRKKRARGRASRTNIGREFDLEVLASMIAVFNNSAFGGGQYDWMENDAAVHMLGYYDALRMFDCYCCNRKVPAVTSP